jgi:hypothetical protein
VFAAKGTNKMMVHSKANKDVFGIGRKLSQKQAEAIANVLYPFQAEIFWEANIEDQDKLIAVIFRETGRELRGEYNLNMVRAYLYDL